MDEMGLFYNFYKYTGMKNIDFHTFQIFLKTSKEITSTNLPKTPQSPP
jgi:hypothetical protein